MGPLLIPATLTTGDWRVGYAQSNRHPDRPGVLPSYKSPLPTHFPGRRRDAYFDLERSHTLPRDIDGPLERPLAGTGVPSAEIPERGGPHPTLTGTH